MSDTGDMEVTNLRSPRSAQRLFDLIERQIAAHQTPVSGGVRGVFLQNGGKDLRRVGGRAFAQHLFGGIDGLGQTAARLTA